MLYLNMQRKIENVKGWGRQLSQPSVLKNLRLLRILVIADVTYYNESGFKQVTEDHSFVNELVRTGQISKGRR